MNYPNEIRRFTHEYVRFFIKRFPYEIFKVLMRPHIEKGKIDYVIKEITEVVGVFNVLKTFIKKLKIDSFVLYELASGDALFSHFIGYSFPGSRVYAVDLKFSEEYYEGGKSKFLDNVFLIEADIKRMNILDADFVVSIHSCNELSEITISLASKNFIVVPCCIGSERYREWKEKNKFFDRFFNSIGNEFYKWVFYLGEFAALRGFDVNFKKDEKILSDRNFIVFGSNLKKESF